MMLRFVIAIVLAAGAWLSWAAADAAGRAADAREQIVTLRYADVDTGVDAVTQATVAYWLGRYNTVAPDTGGDSAIADAEVLRTAANAAFRASQRDPGTGPAVIQRLDGVLQAYASALKASPRDVEAAYNYEYVARLRDQVARAPGKARLPSAPIAGRAGDLPAGPTIHGKPGMPPPEEKLEDLDILTPLEFGDREAQPEATPGAKRERKG
jgi:hypothetical protein